MKLAKNVEFFLSSSDGFTERLKSVVTPVSKIQ